jgi:hypothetical protein
MINIDINTKGLDGLKRLFKNKPEAIKVDIDAIVEAGARTALEVAKKETPVDQGILRGANNIEQIQLMQYRVFNNMPYAPYVEFGTGKKVDVPSEWGDFASSFKGKGKGTYDEGVKAIADWLKRKGGNPEDAKWVFYLILKNGVNAQPFMYPGFKAGRKQLKQDILNYVKSFEL